ncbi:hypothetical protein QQ045_028462 [Rhodiola kirilowii]
MVVRENQLSPSIHQDHYLNLSSPPFHIFNILPLHSSRLHLSILLAFLLRPISLTSLIFAPNMSQDISKSSSHSLSPALSAAKAVAKYIRTYPLYISYLILFSPYILKLLSFLSPLILILLLATALCAFSNTASSSHRFSLLGNKTQENGAYTTRLEAEAYKIIFETFHDSVTSLADDCDEIEAYKQIKIEALVPEIVKSCCSSTPLQDPPSHEIVDKATIISDDDELPCSETAKNTNYDETEIIKHMVCSTFNKPDVNESEEDELVKAAVGVEINKAERPLFTLTTTTTTTQKRESNNEAIVNINQPPTNSTDLHKTSRSFSLPSIESMRREKEWTRTLACKLFEERHNSCSRGGEDGMDMLWETYESIESPLKAAVDQRRTMSRRSRRATAMESEDRAFRVYADHEDEEGDDDVAEEEDDVASGKMCCLQALKMSSGKVNLGIGRKNMMKFSKALKRFGWLHKTTNSNQNAKTRK